MSLCRNCKFCKGQMEDEEDYVWTSYFICSIEGPILAEWAEDDELECDLYVEKLDDYETEESSA